MVQMWQVLANVIFKGEAFKGVKSWGLLHQWSYSPYERVILQCQTPFPFHPSTTWGLSASSLEVTVTIAPWKGSTASHQAPEPNLIHPVSNLWGASFCCLCAFQPRAFHQSNLNRLRRWVCLTSVGDTCVGSLHLTFFDFVLTYHHKYLYHPPQGRKLFQKKTFRYSPLSTIGQKIKRGRSIQLFHLDRALLLLLNHIRPKPTNPVMRV